MNKNSRFPGFRSGVIIAFAILWPFTDGLTRVTPLATRPDWRQLEKYQETMTREEFTSLLARVYAPGGAANGVIEVGENAAHIATGPGAPDFVLRFAPTAESAKPATGFWRGRSQLGPAPPEQPLAGVKVALDPGHLGGRWAQMEERWFRVGNSKPVTEGDMTLLVAKMLVPRLKALGAQVYLTRTKAGPVTSARPNKLREEAAASLADKEKPMDPASLKSESERLFYRVSEIRRRARLVNEKIKPDVVLCLHFNAEAWGSETNPQLVDANHLHFLVTGAWSAEELSYEDQRFDMLVKLLGRTFREEVAVSESVAASMARETGLPPYTYVGASAVRVGSSPYLWARNLLANRLFACPVVYIEPYVMNSRAAFARIQAGDYEGRRNFGGVSRKSIYREYADSVAAGLAAYYGQR